MVDERTLGGLVKWIATALLVAVTVLAVIGIVGARRATPPPPAAGAVILGVCALASVAGLLVLWTRRVEPR
jgi:hypothetical protein